MSKNIQARLVSIETDSDGNALSNAQSAPLVGFRVSVYSGDFELRSGIVDSTGFFDITYQKGNAERTLTLRAYDLVGRELAFFGLHPANPRFLLTEAHRVQFKDVDDDDVRPGDFSIRENDAKGFLVTLGTGVIPQTRGPGDQPTVATGRGLSRGNAVTVLADRDVFKHAATILAAAQKSIVLSQFNFGVPSNFNVDPAQEVPKVVFDFPTPRPDPTLPFKVGPNDPRPERLLLAAANKGADVRVVTHALELSIVLKIIAAVFAFPFAGTDGIFAALGLLDDVGSADELQDYFRQRPKVRVQPFRMPVFNVGIMHTRMTVVDELHGMCQGASFIQSYIDTHRHEIDEPHRGGTDDRPDHDVGIGVTGPAVADLHRNIQLLWNNTEAHDAMPTIGRNPPRQSSGGDALCSVQIVRTITKGRVVSDRPAEPTEKGEQGILEGYLRAIANAEEVIYLENQYFIDGRIGDAIVSAMRNNINLQTIVVLNIKPDVWYLLYPFRQRRLITRIRRAINEFPQQPKRFGVFTRWSHEATSATQSRPRMLPITIHAKVGIVDSKWATVGSANLDYASMDRAIEVNANLLNGVDGEDQSDIVDILRRKLWAEHLGFFNAAGEPDTSASALATKPPTGWLSLWNARADATLQHLKHTPELPLAANMARVLPWPADNETHKEPNDYLKAVGLQTHPLIPHSVVPLTSVRSFNFFKGEFNKDSKAEVDN